MLLTEIRIAENRINQIRDKIDTGDTSDLPTIFPTKSWKTYSHLFISDFDQDELNLINYFYDYGELVEDFAKRNNDYFWIMAEARARVTVQKIGDFIAKNFGNPTADQNIIARRDFLNGKFDLYNWLYAPKKTLDGVKSYLSKIQNITTSSCGSKLKKIAKIGV